jgi:hypothetical protein
LQLLQAIAENFCIAYPLIIGMQFFFVPAQNLQPHPLAWCSPSSHELELGNALLG